MTSKDFINQTYPKMVKNWSHQASMLNYAQVAQLMDDFHEEDYTKIKKIKPRIEKYRCIKDYHPNPITDEKQPTEKAIIKKGTILTFTSNLNAYSTNSYSCAFYEYTLKDNPDCFQPIKNE